MQNSPIPEAGLLTAATLFIGATSLGKVSNCLVKSLARVELVSAIDIRSNTRLSDRVHFGEGTGFPSTGGQKYVEIVRYATASMPTDSSFSRLQHLLEHVLQLGDVSENEDNTHNVAMFVSNGRAAVRYETK